MRWKNLAVMTFDVMMVILATLIVISMLVGEIDAAQAVEPSLEWDANSTAHGYYIGVIDKTLFPDATFSNPDSENQNLIMLYEVPEVDGALPTMVFIKDIRIGGEPLLIDHAYEFNILAYNSCGNRSGWGSVEIPVQCDPIESPGLHYRNIPMSVTVTVTVNGQLIE